MIEKILTNCPGELIQHDSSFHQSAPYTSEFLSKLGKFWRSWVRDCFIKIWISSGLLCR